MKNYIKNVILVMSGGIGSRFGADCPKQYCYMKGRQVIDYVLDACKMSKLADEIVIVTAENYVDLIKEKYGFETTVGGDNRTKSLYNGLKFVYEHYGCTKIIIANAVCPLITSEQIDRYFNLLDQYDYVLTCWKPTSTLGKYDGTLVDRNDFFQCMEPEAYRFPLLHDNYKESYPIPYIFHQLPKESNGFKCFDYPYTMKLTYQRDMKMAELLYEEIIDKPRRELTMKKMNFWLSSFNYKGIDEWSLKLPSYKEELSHKWGLFNFVMNPTAFATCVYEAESKKYGPVILKFHSPYGRYNSELKYYKMHRGDYMAELLDFDDEYRALLIRKIVPGTQVKYNTENSQFVDIFKSVSLNFLPYEEESMSEIPTIMDEFNVNVEKSSKYIFESSLRDSLVQLAVEIYDKYFKNEQLYFLHRDLHRRNLIQSCNNIKVIDPLGVIGPKEFEFTIEFVVEMRLSKEPVELFHNLFKTFSEFVDPERLLAALFFIWVHKMEEYVFCKNDNFEMATWAINMIKELFLLNCSGDNNLRIDLWKIIK